MAAVLPLAGAASAACDDPHHCFTADSVFVSTPSSFIGTVVKVVYEAGQSPAGSDISQFAFWIAVPPNTEPNAAILVGRTTPVFQPGFSGHARASAACLIGVGDRVEVWHDNRWALGAAEAPPGDTLYLPFQVLVRH